MKHMYEIKATKGYEVSFDEKTQNLILSAGRVHKVSFPELSLGQKIGNIKHAAIKLSHDGQYLLLYNSERKIILFHTNDLEHPVLTHLWKKDFSMQECIECNGYFYIPVLGSLYRLGKLPEIDLIECYQMPGVKDDSHPEGFIRSVCFDGEDILLLLHYFDKNNVFVRFNPNNNTVKEIEISYRFRDIFPSNAGGYFLYSSVRSDPLLYYNAKTDIDDQPAKIINLPSANDVCRISHNGRFIAGYSVFPDRDLHMKCWLMDALSGKVLMELNDRPVISVGFSLHDEYWLIGSNNALLVPLADYMDK